VDARLLLTPLMDDLRDRGRDEELARCLTDYTGPLRLEGGEMHVVERHARWLLSRDRLVPDQRVRVLDALARCSPDDELPGRTIELLAECGAAASPYARLCALEARWRLSHYSGEVPTVRVQAAWEGMSLAEQLGDTELEVRLTPREHCWVTFGPAVASLGPVATVLTGLADLEDDPAPARHRRSQRAVKSPAMAAPWWVHERRPPASGAAPAGDPSRRD
jgi:hypothetical protein